MSVEFQSPILPPVVSTLPVVAAAGETCVLQADGHLYTHNGSCWIDNGTSAETRRTAECAIIQALGQVNDNLVRRARERAPMLDRRGSIGTRGIIR